MSVLTVTAKIKVEKDVSDEVDLAKYNVCKTHHCQPVISRICWGKNNSELVARCPQDETDVETCFEGSSWKWNKFNPVLEKEN